tara:strand:- start:5 stop:640 length:636 start_codon:yes stop_codon:yes gene_type:complete
MPDNILLEPLNKFYSNKNNLDELLIILNHKKKKTKKKLSLRLIDWFVTNYCKKEKITIRKKNKEYINIYDSYKSNLKAFSKKVFDPFRRKTKIILHYYEDGKKYKILYTTNIKKKETYIDTTVGQLNFFKWVIENNIYSYIVTNRERIEKDMIKSQKENNNKKLDKNNLITKIITTDDGKEKIITRKKRNELSKNKSKNINLQKIERTLYF